MLKYYFENFYDEHGWRQGIEITLNEAGELLSKEKKMQDPTALLMKGFTYPGFYNGHSHSFQILIAGMTESLSPGNEQDDFWSWREQMYERALTIDPEHLEEVTTKLYQQMIRAGYLGVAEFHYLHKNPQGKNYAQSTELSSRIIKAAKRTGIQLTLVPVFYAQGGFNQKAKPDQRRFLMESCEEYFNLVNDCQKLVAKEKNVKIGMGIHSLRAATPEQVIKIFDHYKNSKKMVKHIHIAEQLKEVVDCQQFLGQRPIEWLLNNVSVDASFHLVHATHLSDHEKKLIIQSGAHVVLCPSTEASLGDGFFPFTDFFKNGGNFSIGSDSQVVINPLEELRWLDFAQRSMLKKRNILCQKAQQESGDLIYLGALKGGRNALGLNPDKLMEIGQPFYALVSRGSDLFFELKPDKFFSTQIYAPALSGADKNLGGAFIAGKWTAF